MMKTAKKRYILEVDVEYPKYLQDLHSDLAFLPEEDHVVRIRALKQSLDHGLVLKRCTE